MQLLPSSLPSDFQEMHKTVSARRVLRLALQDWGRRELPFFRGVGRPPGLQGEWPEVTSSNQIYSYFLSPLLLPLNCLVC